jgi:hypothetical protein
VLVITASDASPATAMVPLPNDTCADDTSSSAATACSTVFAHDAQSMPSTRKRRVPGIGIGAGGAIGNSIGVMDIRLRSYRPIGLQLHS